MANEHETRIEKLEQQVKRLRFRESYILSLARHEPAKDWSSFVLDHDLDSEQVIGITDTLEWTRREIVEGRSPTEIDFEKRLQTHTPSKDKLQGVSRSFVQSLLGSLDGRWHEVVKHYASDFNVNTSTKKLTKPVLHEYTLFEATAFDNDNINENQFMQITATSPIPFFQELGGRFRFNDDKWYSVWLIGEVVEREDGVVEHTIFVVDVVREEQLNKGVES